MWIIVIIVLLALLALIDWMCTQVNIVTDSFSANIFTLLAIVAALIGAVYFWASSQAYKDYKIKEKILKLLNNFSLFDHKVNKKNNSLIKYSAIKKDEIMKQTDDNSYSKNLPTKREIDLSTVDLQSLVGDMKQMLTSPTPIIFKGWGNRRLELDVKRVGLMNEYIQNVIATGQSFIQLKVDAIVSYEKIEQLATKELNELRIQAAESEFGLKLLNKKYENELTKLTTETERMKLDIEKLKLQLRIDKERHEMDMKKEGAAIEDSRAILQLQNDKLEAENYCMIIKTKDESRIRNKVADLFNKIIKNLQLDNISPSQVLILISLFGSGNTANVEDFETKKKLMEETIEKMRQENEYKKQEVKDKYYDVEHKNYKYQKERMSFG
ncbi:MAG: hypothetical protein ACYDA4_14425 [Ignavibacteriaceae bacterium]